MGLPPDELLSLINPAQDWIGLMCKYYLRVQTCYPIAKHSNKDYSELMAYANTQELQVAPFVK